MMKNNTKGKRKDISATFRKLSRKKYKTAFPYFFSRQATTSRFESFRVKCHQSHTNRIRISIFNISEKVFHLYRFNCTNVSLEEDNI